MKLCTCCNQNLAIELFSRNKRRPDGLSTWCKSCNKEYSRGYARRNSQAAVTRVAEWRKSNPESRKSHTKSYYERNKAYYHSKVHERRSLQRKSLVSQDDQSFMQAVYQFAESWNSAVPPRFKLHVDHIVPLKHELVCGLHNASNIQLLLASENWSKNNFFETESRTP